MHIHSYIQYIQIYLRGKLWSLIHSPDVNPDGGWAWGPGLTLSLLMPPLAAYQGQELWPGLPTIRPHG